MAGSKCWTLLMAAAVLAAAPVAHAEPPVDPRDARIAKLERELGALTAEVRGLRGDTRKIRQERQKVIADMIAAAGRESRVLDKNSWVNKFTIGGYGEMHANFAEGQGADQFDLHRLVLAAGYEFTDWIRLAAEIEVEHAYSSKSSGGEVIVEQLYVDFDVSDTATIRVGRILTPLGIINNRHEPPSFNGVERPAFATYIIPSTWSSDGVGLVGRASPEVTYEVYVVGGLDGSGFDAMGGLRGGRQKERPGLHEPAVTGRVDVFPLARRAAPHGQTLRVGVSGYAGGIDNANKGAQPGIDGEVYIASADAEYTIGRFDFRGAIAHITIEGAAGLAGSGTAEQILGWYVEGAYHFLPESAKKGKLAKADAVVFVRYDDYDTQYKMPSGVRADGNGDRTACTFGISFFPVPNVVIKADVQILSDQSESSPAVKTNLGVGWQI